MKLTFKHSQTIRCDLVIDRCDDAQGSNPDQSPQVRQGITSSPLRLGWLISFARRSNSGPGSGRTTGPACLGPAGDLAEPPVGLAAPPGDPTGRAGPPVEAGRLAG